MACRQIVTSPLFLRSIIVYHIYPPYITGLIYDPDQDPEEKRAVRKDYRSLAKTVEGTRFNLPNFEENRQDNYCHRAANKCQRNYRRTAHKPSLPGR